MSCTTDTETFGDYPVGEAVAVKDPDATFSAAGCTLTGSGDVLDIDEKRSYYVINTGADRSDVELSAVDGTTLDVSHLRPGDGCATTADWRGNLILVVDTATPPASVPEVNYTVVQEQC